MVNFFSYSNSIASSNLPISPNTGLKFLLIKKSGSPFCKIRKCAQNKKIEGCWDCNEFESCKELKFLEPVHGDAHIKNLRDLKKEGKKDFVKGKTFCYNID